MQKALRSLLDKLSRFISSTSNSLGDSDQRRNNTEYKHLEGQLKILSIAVEQSPSTILVTDTSGRIEYVNPKFTQLTGYTYEEAIGQNPRILKTDKTPPEVHECLWKTITSGRAWRGEFCNKKKNGDLYWESASISPVKNSEGTITNFVAVKEDITECKKMEEKLKLFNKYLEERVVERTEKLKAKNIKLLKEIVWREQAEETLKESEEKYRQITSTASDAVMVFDSETRQFVDVNKACEEIYGYTREEFLNMKHADITAEVAASEKEIQETLAGKRHKIPIRYHRKKDGIVFPVEISASSFVHKGRKVFCGMIRDITARRQAERRLAAQHAVTKVLSESITIKEALLGILSSMCSVLEWDLGEVWLFDPKNNVLRCSEIWHTASVDVPDFKAVTRQSAFAPGIGLPGYVLSKAKPVWIADVVHDANFPRASVAEREGLHGAFGFPILVGREVLGIISIYSREIKEPDKELLDMVNDIGCRIGLFIRRNRAEEQIKASLTEKEVLLDEVHHRVKNNLQIISSLLDMSSMQTQNQETIKLFAESRSRVESMALIHSQLYESERFDEINMQMHIQELSGNLLNIYSKEKTIALEIQSANVYLPVTLAVPCALVLNELISNSMKHAYRDGQQGTISISMQQSNDGTTLLKVKDTGVGIPVEIDIERTKSLGLKLVRNIVYKQLNGTMKIVRNKGTELTVEFKHSKGDS
ncbi:MAG: PAS domain-containing sensor histidine kinase [Candidatus Scalindua sp.]